MSSRTQIPKTPFHRQAQSRSILAVVMSMCSVQIGAALAKHLFPVLTAPGVTTLRILIAAVLLCIIWPPRLKTISRQALKLTALYGLTLGAMNLFFYLALDRIPLGIAVALEFTGPLAVAIFSSRKKLDYLWAALAVAGVILLLPLDGIATTLDPIGILFALGAASCWAAYILCGKQVANSMPGIRAVALGMAFASLFTLPAGILLAGPQLLQISPLPSALSVAVLSSALPYSLEMIALKRMPAKTFGIWMSLEPVIAALSGFFFLRESLSPVQVSAIACIIAGSIGSSLTGHAETELH